jgi:hypothetical protein
MSEAEWKMFDLALGPLRESAALLQVLKCIIAVDE